MRIEREADGLRTLVTSRLSHAVPPPIATLAEAARARHGEVQAVLAYGSCLRGIDPRETLADFYVLTDSFGGVSSNPVSRLGCRLLPPNVYYLETPHEGEIYRAKYAVLPLDQFEDWVAPSTRNPYFWARFSQPSALVWARDDSARDRVVDAVMAAINTMVGEARLLEQASPPQQDRQSGAVGLWERVLAETYRTELRAESSDRGKSIVAADLDWYAGVAGAVHTAAKDQLTADEVAQRWLWRRRQGKLLAALRLIKAAFTFQGGADYLAWKIERHSKVKVELSDWQRRHPILAAITLMPRLYRRGGFR